MRISRPLSGCDVYSVSRLNRESKCLLSDAFPSLWITGEVSNVSRASSGHLYFTLKDAQAQVRCAMFRHHQRSTQPGLKNGKQVLLRAQVSLYESRGDYQLIVEYLEDFGEGELRQAFEALKLKLAAEGLFDSDRKQAFPWLPRRIGVITSASGAALQDVLTVLKRRFAAIPITVFSVPVQGKQATVSIVAALRHADQQGHCDVLLLARGGGSLEDLWAFNEELVARAIDACQTPVITGIGHEVDVTIADLVADSRAATPSAAAEQVSPDQRLVMVRFREYEVRLRQLLRAEQRQKTQRLNELLTRLQQLHPGARLQQYGQRLDELELRLQRVLQLQLQHRRQALAYLSRALEAISPLATVSRGYALVSRVDDKAMLRSARAVQTGELIRIQLASGQLTARVETCLEQADSPAVFSQPL